MASDPNGVLTPDDYTYYAVQRRRVNDTYGMGVGQNAYQAALLQRQRDKGISDVGRAYEGNVRKLPQPFAKRGMLNSGLYGRARFDMENDRQRALKGYGDAYNDQMAGLYVSHMQLGQTKDSALSDVDMQEEARRATALAIKAGGGGVY